MFVGMSLVRVFMLTVRMFVAVAFVRVLMLPARVFVAVSCSRQSSSSNSDSSHVICTRQ